MRKEYNKPIIVTEERLEQTSLACDATGETDFPNFTEAACQVDATKNNNWGPPLTCTHSVFTIEDTCNAQVLS